MDINPGKAVLVNVYITNIGFSFKVYTVDAYLVSMSGISHRQERSDGGGVISVCIPNISNRSFCSFTCGTLTCFEIPVTS